MPKVSMPKATAAIVSLLVVVAACICVLFRPASAALAAAGIVALLLVLLLVVAKAGADSQPSMRCGTRLLRYAAPALLVLATPLLMWASFTVISYPVVTVLSTGGVTLSAPGAVAVDSQGNVYIADTGHNQVVEVTAAGVASVVSFPGLSPALGSANAVAVDGSGNLYVADSTNSRVVELSGGAASVVATASLLTNPSGPAFDAGGDLYIADATHNYIVKVPSGGGTAATLSITGLGATPLSQPYGLAFDIPGNLYIADSANNRIVEVTPAGAGSALTITGETLNSPLGVAVDGFGSVYVADDNNSRIVTVAPGGAGAVLDAPLFGEYASPVPLTLSQPAGVAVSASGIIYIANTNGNQIVEAMPSGAGFGHLPVGAGSGTTLTAPFLVGFSTIGSVQAYTLGTSALDFTVVAGSGTTCVAGFSGSGGDVACTVQVAFLPTGPGLRRGAVVIYDTSTPPVPLITVPLYGTADAPLATLSPGTASVISTGGVSTSTPFQIALDGVGNMYVADYEGTNVVKVPPGGGTATVVSTGVITLGEVAGVALDGAGNLFITDHFGDRVVEVTAGGVASVLTITGLSPGLSIPTALAVDAADNLYISDYGTGRVIKVTPAGAGSVVGTGTFTPAEDSVLGVAVDAAGTIYFPDSINNRVIKVTAAGAASLVIPAGITPVLSSPNGVAVDGFGNLYIGDAGNDRIVEVTTTGTALVIPALGLPSPSSLGSFYAIAVDPSGNVLIPDFSNSRLVSINLAGAVLAFPNTDVGSTSPPQTATVTNIGDLPLVFATVPTYTANFSEDTGDENLCALSTSLGAGTLCDVSVEFTPQSGGSLSAGIVVTNNSLNLTATTQNVAVSGTGIVVADTTAVAVSTNPTAANIGQPVTITAMVTDTTAGHSATIPTGGVTFTDTVGATVISLNGGTAVVLNGAGTAILAGVTLSGAGVHTITAHYAGVTGSFAASSNSAMLTVSKDPAILAGPVTQPVQVPSGTAGSVPFTVTGPYSMSVVAAPTGSLSYSILNSSNTSVASGTAPLTAGSTNSTATVPLASSLAPGSYTVSVTYGGDVNYAASAAATTVAVVVGLITPTIDWTEPAPITYGATLSGVLNASAVNGSTAVPGSFAYTATPQGGSAGAVTAATVLGAGSYTLLATFTPTDTTTYASASATVSLTVAKASPAVALTSSGNPAVVSSTVTFTATVSSSVGSPSGSVSFYDGTTLLGSSTLTLGVAAYATSGLALGAHSITAAYGGSGNFSALTSSVLTETVTVPPTITTTTTLTASPNPLADGQPATLTATVTPAPTGSPAGIVGFYSGTTLLGTGTLDASGVATYTTSSLVVGADSITAVYPGNASFAASTSSAVSETVDTAYTVIGPTTPVPVAPGGHATFNLTVPPVGGAFDSLVTLSATGLPPGATATFNPPTVTPGIAGAPTVMTIQLATLAASDSARDLPGRHKRLPLLPFTFGFAVFGAVLGRRRIPRTLALALALAVLGVGTLAVTGCGGGFANTPSTPAGNYTVTVTGTSGSFQASTTVILVVQ